MAKNKQWKAIQVDWETLQGFSNDDEDYAYYKLTPRQAAFLQAWTEFGNWESRWLNLGEPMDDIKDFVSQTDLNLMEENSMIVDCDEVEACLPTAPTIVNMSDDISDNSTDIVSNADDIVTNSDDIDDLTENPADGNTYNPIQPDAQSDEACQITGHLANEVGNYIAQIDTYSDEPNLLDALTSAMNGQFNYAVDELIVALNNFFVGGADPLFSTYQSQETDVHEELYCSNDMSKDDLATWAVSNLTRGQEISDMLNSIALTTWQQWQVLGQYASTYDCSSFGCGDWCHRWTFSEGLGDWSLIRGTITVDGLQNVDNQIGNNYFSDSGVQLDWTGSNVTQLEMYGNFVFTAIQNSSCVELIKKLGGSGIPDWCLLKTGGWNGNGVISNPTLDVTGWTGASVRLQSAARANQPYTPPAESYIQWIELSGTGANPYGSNNCS